MLLKMIVSPSLIKAGLWRMGFSNAVKNGYCMEENFGDQKVLRIYNCGNLAKNSLAKQ